MDALNALPTSDAVMVVNLRHILTEVLPRVMPAGKVTEMGSFFDAMKLMSEVDLRQIDSIALGMRMPKNISARMMPEVAIVAHGSFASAKVIGALQRFAPAKAREELYRDSKIYVFDLSQVLDAPPTATLITPNEISLAALNTNTIAIGSLANVQRTIEAREGHGGINPALVALATRNPRALVSLASIDLKPKDADVISTSVQSEDEIIQALSSITHLYAAIEMLETDFQFLMFARTRTPRQTIPLRDVIISALDQLGKMVKDSRAKSIFNNLQIKMQTNEVQVTTRIPVETIATFIREMQPQPPPKLDVPVINRPRTRRRARRRKVH
jgi:hypothetical protein